ncbi:MAG: hypothetical protein ACFFDF_23050 [Candidatus Odinarchaeota archaeon]
MDKLSKFDKENIILREIFKNGKFIVKDWLNEQMIPKNSINYLIKSLETEGFIKTKSQKPKIVDFTHKISKILLLIEKSDYIFNNELSNNFNYNNIDNIIERLIDAKIVSMDIKNKKVCYRIYS